MKYDIILNGKDEFYKNLNNKTYNILKVDTLNKETFMCNIFNNFIKNMNDNLKEKHYLGIDFEFKQVAKVNREVALMQINLENDSNIGYIFVLYPPSLTKDNYNLLIKLISHPEMIKILHGAESLDIPYLFNQVLITPTNINNFCNNFYDTRYLCEYYHIVNNINDKCSIYNLLLNKNIVTPEKIIELENIENITGPIYLITMDIYNLNPEILRYSLYDVIYLPELIKKFINMGTIYNKIIPQITSIINKYKRLIENQFNDLIVNVNSLNICFIYDGVNRIILKDIWETYYYTILNKKNYLYYLREINYFKSFCETITKCVIYSNILKYFKVYKNKMERSNNIDFNIYFDWIHSYSYVNDIIIEYNNNVIDDLNKRMYVDKVTNLQK
jgi:hypothetical protein